ncbi:MAG: NUDIX domain-containing protein [Candidatus Thorarchaeota archaeon]
MHKNPKPTVDIAATDGKRVILVKRGRDPFKGSWVLPGGFIEYGETVEDAARREMLEETGIQVELIDVLGVYSDPNRDPRGHQISIVFVGRPLSSELNASDDAEDAMWRDLDSMKPGDLAFDHDQVVSDLKRWLKSQGTYWSKKSREKSND